MKAVFQALRFKMAVTGTNPCHIPGGLYAPVKEQLGRISRATVGRLLQHHRCKRRRLPQKGAERANQVSKGIPMGRIDWETKEAGHFEVYLVHHSGPSAAGEYLHALQLVDVATGWSERVALKGCGQQAMEAAFEHVLTHVPFALPSVTFSDE